MEPLTPDMAAQLKVGRKVSGLVLTEVDLAVPAMGKSGQGDSSIQINGVNVKTLDEYNKELAAAKTSDRPYVMVRFLQRDRDGKWRGRTQDIEPQW